MSDIKLYRFQGGVYGELPGSAARLEKELQHRIEANMDVLLGVRFLASEHVTGKKHRGRIDSLGLDENNCPVIVEYKRSMDENVINQGLFYLDWLMDHQGEFQLLVQQKLGEKTAEQIDWSSPRLLCIAGGFTRYDEHAVKQINRNIDLVRYLSFAPDLLLLELVHATTASGPPAGPRRGNADCSPVKPTDYKTIAEMIPQLDPERAQLLADLRELLSNFGDDVQEKELKYYLAFKRMRNFACVEVRTQKKMLVAYLQLNPDEVELEDGFTRDMRGIGHYGTGDLEVILRNQADLDRAEPMLRESYAAS